ncbi:short-chain dehydrogenase [Pseudomonas asuensis]|uniref:Short-chain dehydrogenase n=1 Tax=Pseudomonas asuensis TaxID=1825787 RepID=A0ABQ2GPH1_9PSED|nr:SDR family oxidoreductase [Pseudomonas asuensis]GGM06468.1 short-chain dehydrogenase [Pseudomonas asuensis]
MKARNLEGVVVVITGASSGIGRAAAHEFARQGASLVLAARDEAALEDVMAECTLLGGQAIAVPTDVTLMESVEQLAERALAFGQGRIDVWVNNAGIGAVGKFDETPFEAHERVVQTDLLGYLRGAYAVVPVFKRQGAGILINTLSVGSWVPLPYAVAYSAAKSGLRGFTEALRGELTRWSGIHVCDVYPAFIDTPGLRDGGNYSGRTIKPTPPVYDARKVARAILSMARYPRKSTTVGQAATVLRAAHALVPGYARLSRIFMDRALSRMEPVEHSSGNLFGPPSGNRSVDGGWRRPDERMVVAATSAAALVFGAYLYRRLTERSD